MQAAHRPGDPPRAPSPARTCVGCRRCVEQSDMLRVVAGRPGPGPLAWTIVPDERRRRPGRGAYVHPDPECVQTALQRKAFGRALREQGQPDDSVLWAWLAAHAPSGGPTGRAEQT